MGLRFRIEGLGLSDHQGIMVTIISSLYVCILYLYLYRYMNIYLAIVPGFMHPMVDSWGLGSIGSSTGLR